MSRIDWLEIEGKRYDERAVSRVSEYRCDACGEFVTEPVVTVQMQIFVQWQPVSLPQYHFHPPCARERFSFALPDVSQQGIHL